MPLSLNLPAPIFTLQDLSGNTISLDDLRGKIVVINFWSAECPWVSQVDPVIVGYLQTWGDAVRMVNIASNTHEPLEMVEKEATKRNLPLVLLDPTQETARTYGAVTTPHLFVVDGEGTLRYQGAFNDRTFRNRNPSQWYLKDAVDALIAGNQPDPGETQPYGCTIMYEEEASS